MSDDASTISVAEGLGELAADLAQPPLLAGINDLAALWRYDIYRAVCPLPKDIQDFPELSTRVRGAFGQALHGLPERRTLRGKLVPRAFEALFAPLAMRTGATEVPRPLAIRAWVEGDRLIAEVRVFGWGMLWHREVGAALLIGLRNGVALHESTRVRVPIEPDDIAYARCEGVEIPPGPTYASLAFRSPIAVRSGGRVRDDPSPVIQACLRRVSAMARWQGVMLPKSLPIDADGAPLTSIEARDWRAYRWKRHSRRAGDRAIPVVGMLGTIVVRGDLNALAPWLALAETCNVGSHASLGLGWFDLAMA